MEIFDPSGYELKIFLLSLVPAHAGTVVAPQSHPSNQSTRQLLRLIHPELKRQSAFFSNYTLLLYLQDMR